LSTREYTVLIIAANSERQPYPVYPLGASMIAGVLSREPGVTVYGVDCSFVDDPVRAALAAADAFQPDLIALSIRAVDNTCYLAPRFYMDESKLIASSLRGRFRVPIVLGGSGFSLFPRRILDEIGADLGVVGEGERAAVELVRALRAGRSPAGIVGLMTRDGPRDVVSPGAMPLPPECWGEPSLTIFPLTPHTGSGGMASVQTKRGCPRRCTYCTYPLLEGRQLRLRAPGAVAKELAGYRSAGINRVFIVDSNFNLPIEHAEAICRELCSLDAPVGWSAFLSPLGVTEQLAELISRSGARSLEFGAESGAAETLAALGKHHSPADIVRADRSCRRVGIAAVHYFMFGGPGETRETVNETLELIEELEGPIAGVVGIRIYPGTGLHQRAIAEGVVSEGVDMLKPTFYLSPKVDRDWMLERVRSFAADRMNFILVGEPTPREEAVTTALRRRGRSGALWEYL